MSRRTSGAAAAAALLRPDLLGDVRVVVAGDGELGRAAAAACAALGARVAGRPAFGDEDAATATAAAAVSELGGVDALVWDGAAAAEGAGDEPAAPVRAALDGAWLAIRSVAAAALLPPNRGGLLVLLTPPPGGAERAAARAGLENLARTLSIEWARFHIRPVAVVPGATTAAADVGRLVAYLASPAGAYFAGCSFALGLAADGR